MYKTYILWKKNDMKEESNKFDEFRNNVFSRRESNQHKAKLLWEKIKHKVPKDKCTLFETEWNHYCMGEFDSDLFGMDINKIREYIN